MEPCDGTLGAETEPPLLVDGRVWVDPLLPLPLLPDDEPLPLEPDGA